MGTDHVLIQYISNACYLTKNRFKQTVFKQTAYFVYLLVIDIFKWTLSMCSKLVLWRYWWAIYEFDMCMWAIMGERSSNAHKLLQQQTKTQGSVYLRFWNEVREKSIWGRETIFCHQTISNILFSCSGKQISQISAETKQILCSLTTYC